MSSIEEPEPVSAEDRAYFRALEESFLQLRGRTTLLGPEDFRVAQTWRHAGIPAALVQRVMADLFTRQRQRKSRRGISSLRYFRAAVEAAWSEHLEVGAGGSSPERSDPGPPVHLRLERLASALPSSLAEAAETRTRLLALEGDFEKIESALGELEGALLERLSRSLSDAERLELEARLERALARLSTALPESERSELMARLRVQALRSRFSLPLLSLFAPQALEGAADDES